MKVIVRSDVPWGVEQRGRVNERPEVYNIRCEPHKPQYLKVLLYPTRASMIRALGRDNSEGSPECEACVIERINTRCIGRIFFHVQNVPPDVVAHEMLHATMLWCERNKINPLPSGVGYSRYRSQEERTARVLDRLVREFYKKQKKRIYFIAGDGVRAVEVERAREKLANKWN